jgi:ribonuclease HI
MFRNSLRYETLAMKIRYDMKELNIGDFPPILEQNVPKTPPWIIPKTEVCFHMENFPKNITPTSQIKAEFLKHKHNSKIDLYTDGSKTNNTAVGAGIALCLEINKPQNIFNQNGIALNSKSSILSAELKAISIGLDVIAKTSDKTLAVYSDSKGALQSIMQYDPNNPLVQEIQAKLSTAFAYNNKVTFCWIPSHREILGNEYADKQAYQASQKTSPKHYPVVAKDLNAYIAEQGKKWLQNQWDAQDRNKLHFVDGEIGEKNFHSFKTRLDEIKYTRIRLGHSRLTNKHLAAGEEAPQCMMCNRPITIKHIFTTCPLYAEARKRFFEPNHQNFKKILDRKSFENCNKVLNFLKYTKLYCEI